MTNFWILSNLYRFFVPFCRKSLRGQMLVWPVHCPFPFFDNRILNDLCGASPTFVLSWKAWMDRWWSNWSLLGQGTPASLQWACWWRTCDSGLATHCLITDHHDGFMDGHIDPRWFIWNVLWNIGLEVLATICYHMGPEEEWAGKAWDRQRPA